MTRSTYCEWGDKLLVTCPCSKWMAKEFCGDTLRVDRSARILATRAGSHQGELFAQGLTGAGVQGSHRPFVRAMAENKFGRSEMRETGHQICHALLDS